MTLSLQDLYRMIQYSFMRLRTFELLVYIVHITNVQFLFTFEDIVIKRDLLYIDVPFYTCKVTVVQEDKVVS